MLGSRLDADGGLTANGADAPENLCDPGIAARGSFATLDGLGWRS
jgi:hypothetical protein